MAVAQTERWIARQRLRGLLLRGHKPSSPERVVHGLLAVQAQEHGSARWSLGQRTAGGVTAEKVDEEFDRGQILRTHALRPTWHYVTPADLRWVIALTGPRVDAGATRYFRSIGLDGPTLDRSNGIIAEAVSAGPLTRSQLASRLESAGIPGPGDRVGAMVMHAELSAIVCSGPMRGKQDTYASFDELVPPGGPYSEEESLAELAWRYFSTRGPASVRDFGWWAGLNAGDARRGLELTRRRLDSFEVGDLTYWMAEPAGAAPPSGFDLIQCYDEIVVSYRESRPVMVSETFGYPTISNVGGYRHPVLRDGRLVGHWRVTKGSDGIETRLTTDLGRADRERLEKAAARYRAFSRPFTA